MRVPRFFVSSPLTVGEHVILTDAAFHHAIRVLRLRVSAEIILFNGTGGEYQALIESVTKQQASVLVQTHRAVDVESVLPIILVQAVCKGERMDYILQKAVELGAAEIALLQTERSVPALRPERLQKRMQHWQGVINAACEQSGRNSLPLLHAPVGLLTWLKSCSDQHRKLLFHPFGVQRLSQYVKPSLNQRVVVLVGPEGGFTDTEVAHAVAHGFVIVRLGPRILRTETAGVAALAALQALWGDLA